ncbi:MAG TPA: 30S ribosomal protein S17 [Candidatus Woesebacteria bacterium]|nr:30S ribosomal protein S17 [Candidatus Woesebacteria bacterium]
MQIFTGTVVSAKVPQTLVIEIRTKLRHPLYKKVINTTKKLKVHCEIADIKEGDVVQVRQSRPISKTKHHEMVAKVS